MKTPLRRMRLLFTALFSWLFLVCVLGAWWGSLILKHAFRIAELERVTGLASSATESHWLKTQRMLYWEGASFFLLLLASTVFLIWLYWRDLKRSKAIQAFFASLTHELRTPLTSIRLQAESIAEDRPGSPLIQRLLEDTLRLESQVERTLELARVEGGGPVFTRPLRIKPWIERTLKAWTETHAQRLRIESEIDDFTIEADSTAVQVILKNLLENSLRHLKQDRISVSLKTRKTPEGVKIFFRDNGDGFTGDPRNLGKIFYKGPSSSGAGVGLYLVRVLMERMGGKAEFKVDPIENGFTGFHVSLLFREMSAHG